MRKVPPEVNNAYFMYFFPMWKAEKAKNTQRND